MDIQLILDALTSGVSLIVGAVIVFLVLAIFRKRKKLYKNMIRKILVGHTTLYRSESARQ